MYLKTLLILLVCFICYQFGILFVARAPFQGISLVLLLEVLVAYSINKRHV